MSMPDGRRFLAERHQGGVYGLVVDGGQILSGGGEGTVILHGVAPPAAIEVPEGAGVLGMKRLPGTGAVFIAGMRGLALLDPIRRVCSPVEGPRGWVRAIACDEVGCAAVGDDGSLWCWRGDALPRAVNDLGGQQHQVALARAGTVRLAATIDSWRNLVVTAIDPPHETRWRAELPDDNVPLIIGHGEALAIAGDDGRIRFVNAHDGEPIRELASASGVTAMHWDARGLVTGHRDLTLRLWSPATGASERTWPSGHETWINAIAPFERGYATGDDAGRVAVDFETPP